MSRPADRSFADALGATSDLSSFSSVLSLNPRLLETFSSTSGLTVLAPSNTAFGRVDNATLAALTGNPVLLTAVLQYHILNGTFPFNAVLNRTTFVPTALTNPLFTNVTRGQVVQAIERAGSPNVTFYSGLLSNSTITTPNITYTGGIIHVVDRMLTLPPDPTDTMAAANLTSLRGALNATSLVNVIDTTPNVTIFAPLNMGFQSIGSALANLTMEQISSVLTYHVVAGNISYSSNFQNGAKIRTVEGRELTITVGNGRVFVNNALVLTSDILTANGVIHVIDEVLNPTNQTVASSSWERGTPVYAGATPIGFAPFTSGQPTPTGSLVSGIPSRPSTSASSTASTNPGGSSPAGLSTGAKAGIGVGAALGALLLIGFVWFFIFRRRKRPASATEASHVSELPDQDRDLASRKWFIGGKWRNEVPSEQKRHELDATALPVELDATERPREIRAPDVYDAPPKDVTANRGL